MFSAVEVDAPNTIITLINEYNEKKGETDENRGLQSKSS